MSNLPALCFHVNNMTDEVIMIVRGESGYYPCIDRSLKGKETADDMNADIGVSKAQAEAMFVGSMFGWNVPGANPDLYDEAGKPKDRSTHKSQGKERAKNDN